MAKLALVAPAGIVTLAGTPAAVLSLLDRATTAPPSGAGALKTTVPLAALPPITLGGTLSEMRAECWMSAVGIHVAPLSTLLKTPPGVPAESVVGTSGSIARAEMLGKSARRSRYPVKSAPSATQVAPPSVLLRTPRSAVPA